MKKRREREREKGERIMDAIADDFDLPRDVVSGCARVELCGNREAIIDGCRGVLEYRNDLIAVNTGRLTVRVCGREMTIVSMRNGRAVVKGIIAGIDFCD